MSGIPSRWSRPASASAKHSAVSDRYEDIAARLDVIAEEIAELAFDVLREAAAAGETKNPEEGKRLTRAQRSAQKAASILRHSS